MLTSTFCSQTPSVVNCLEKCFSFHLDNQDIDASIILKIYLKVIRYEKVDRMYLDSNRGVLRTHRYTFGFHNKQLIYCPESNDTVRSRTWLSEAKSVCQLLPRRVQCSASKLCTVEANTDRSALRPQVMAEQWSWKLGIVNHINVETKSHIYIIDTCFLRCGLRTCLCWTCTSISCRRFHVIPDSIPAILKRFLSTNLLASVSEVTSPLSIVSSI